MTEPILPPLKPIPIKDRISVVYIEKSGPEGHSFYFTMKVEELWSWEDVKRNYPIISFNPCTNSDSSSQLASAIFAPIRSAERVRI